MLDKVLIDFFEKCRECGFERETTMFQGGGYRYGFDVIKTLKEAGNQEDILDCVTALAEKDDFKVYVLGQVRRGRENDIRRWERKQLVSCNDDEYRYYDILISKAKEYLVVLDWNWYVENNCKTYCNICQDAKDWRWILLDHLFGYYVNTKYGLFLDYIKGCPLEKYLIEKKIDPSFTDNYGLLHIDKTWVLKSGKPSKVFVPHINTHVLLRHTPSDLIALVDRWRIETVFDLALRPDYNVCGDNILDLQYICEEKDFGRSYSGQLSTIGQLSKYYDREWANDWLIVQHTGKDVTFEEVLEDGPHDQDYYVTQVVHMQFYQEGEHEYITHIDHEYVFYDESGIEAKRNNLQEKGEARNRYKTFKIDNARIPFVNEAKSNVLYKVLTCYFTKGELVDEFFKG